MTARLRLPGQVPWSGSKGYTLMVGWRSARVWCLVLLCVKGGIPVEPVGRRLYRNGGFRF